jgi:NADP-dependent aldehyde dehydrogenase
VSTVEPAGAGPQRIAASGHSIVSGRDRPGEGEAYRALDPRTGRDTGPEFRDATAADVTHAVEEATLAFRSADDDARPTWRVLDVAADLLTEHGESVIAAAETECGLATGRLDGELTRTIGQLRFLARVAASGERLGATIDSASGPQPGLARVGVPVGPVAVFGASNFPLAFGVLGGDTAAAFAAGCPVVAKAHEAHPSTSELCGRVIAEAVLRCDLAPGWFSLVHGRGHSVGTALVSAHGIRAVAFTGSLGGGKALFDLAVRRPEPIPVYAEMGSTNPVFITQAALAARSAAIASSLADSVTGSAGQLCTKPGLLFLESHPDAEGFARQLADEVASRDAQPMLTEPIHDEFQRRLRATVARSGVETLSGAFPESAGEQDARDSTRLFVRGAVLRTTLECWLRDSALSEEHFGPAAIIVDCPPTGMIEAARAIEGSLTATLHLEASEHERCRPLVRELARRAGRVLVGGAPTGVRVSRAMHHGGPFPATTFARDTSVGGAAIDRFLRPVCFQSFPDDLLPPALQHGNPLRIERRVDGVLVKSEPGGS